MHTHYVSYTAPQQLQGSRYACDQTTVSSTTGLTPVTDVHHVVNSNNKRLLDASYVGSNSMLALRRNGSDASASGIGNMSDDSDNDVVLPSATKGSRSNSITSTPQLNNNKNNSNSSNSNSSSASGGVLPYEPLPPTPRDNGPRSTPNPYWPMTYSPPESMSSSDVHETVSEAIRELRPETVSNNNSSSSSNSSNSMNNMNNISSNDGNNSSSSDSSAQAAPAKRRRDDIDDTDVAIGALDDSTLDADKNSKRAKRS
jgi:hypothetical protein